MDNISIIPRDIYADNLLLNLYTLMPASAIVSDAYADNLLYNADGKKGVKVLPDEPLIASNRKLPE